MESIVLIVHIIVSAVLIGFILIQHGKGAETGAAFGSGASQTFFGSQGSGNFLTRATAILVTLFFITSLGLGYVISRNARPQDLDQLLQKVEPTLLQESKPSEKAEIPEKKAEQNVGESQSSQMQDKINNLNATQVSKPKW